MKHLGVAWVLSLVLYSCSSLSTDDGSPGIVEVAIYSVTATPTASEQISLINNTQHDMDISDWTLGDLNNPVAYGMPHNTILPTGQIKTFIHTTLGFQINDSGEVIYLKDGAFVTRDTWGN